jgi:DNA helicase-2/ATP-dependent DNA helicase PcrA
MPKVFSEFEQLRTQKFALTFDDFVPVAVQILTSNKTICDQCCGHVQHVIVDEYQDVNLGQQRLVELLAGRRADIMVVGDDDQTIYEWRGARPAYIIREFQSVFTNKPHADYKLSRSFRFGPVIAQAAFNTITFNTTRVAKPLVAHFADREAYIHLFEEASEQPSDPDKDLVDHLVSLVNDHEVSPSHIVVLGRMFAQLGGVEAEFVYRGVPYRVEGQLPFFQRREIQTLLDYQRVALSLSDPTTEQTQRAFQHIANTPQRMLTRTFLERSMKTARSRGQSVENVLEQLSRGSTSPFNAPQRERLHELHSFLQRVAERVNTESNLGAGDLLRWIVAELDYFSHFDSYYGYGEDSNDRKIAIEHFIGYAAHTGMQPLAFLRHIDALDPTQGEPEDKQILVTTVFRQKGAEYDYVFLPRCEEGYMPCHYDTRCMVFDTANIVKEPEPSESIENERRLFYVALTRSIKAAFISTSRPPDKGVQDQSARLPSRFLAELRLPETEHAMSAIQQVACSADNSKENLLRAAAHAGGIRVIRDNLLAYLSDLGQHQLAAEVGQTLASCPDTPFVYPFAYPVFQDGRLRRDQKVTNAAQNAANRGSAWRRVRRK